MKELAALDTYFKLMTMNGGAYVFNTVMKMGLLKPFMTSKEVTAEFVAKERGLNPQTVTLLYDVLCSIDLIEKTDNKYFLAPVYEMMGGNYENLSSDYWEHLPTFILEDTPYKKMDQIEESEEVYQNEVKSLGKMMEPSATLLAKTVQQKFTNILDLGAGSGIWSSHFVMNNLEAYATCIDWPAVLKVAKERAAKCQIADKVSFIEGNYHEVDYGTGYDLAILGNVAHLETDEALLKLFGKIHHSLGDSGKILIVDCYGSSEQGELARSLYKLGLSLRTVNGRVPTPESLKNLLSQSKFSHIEYIPLEVTPFTMGAYIATKS